MWWWCSLTKGRSNLERFLFGATPKPASFSLPQRPGKEEVEYFRLSDLWEWFDELSAFGLGSKAELNNGESLMQYYVPYLSAIQIRANKPASASRSESSECWSDNESDKLSRSVSNQSSKAWDTISEESVYDPGDAMLRDRPSCFDFKYIETDPPYQRVNLTVKINELAAKCPELMTLRSIDLAPTSWMAVAWYPIYHIPSCRSEKDLSSSFLTYHTLSSCFHDKLVERDNGNSSTNYNNGKEAMEFGDEEEYVKRIPLPAFGLVPYKMQGELWRKTGYDVERLMFLQKAVESWLKQLNVDHHDFNFFKRSSF